MPSPKILFPHSEMRAVQDRLVKRIYEGLSQRKSLILHAPTGLGKTAASLAPAVTLALEKKLTILFLTSRHTQHLIALDTLKQMKEKHSLKLNVSSIIGKKHMCLQPNVTKLHTNDFNEYCRKMKEDDLCEFYSNLKKGEKWSSETGNLITEIKRIGPITNTVLMEKAANCKLCPYEISILVAKEAQVIIGDYYYAFHPRIREAFFKKIEKELENCILIIDEAHNLPNRLKDLSSAYLSSFVLSRASLEANKLGYAEVEAWMTRMFHIFEEYAHGEEEQYITKEDFLDQMTSVGDYDEIIERLTQLGDQIREDQKQSFLGSVASFLEAWKGNDAGFARIFSKKQASRGEQWTLSYRCLDPSLIAAPVLERTYGNVLMSGTLTPTSMYREVLGIDAEEETFESPFPHENRLNVVIPKTSTKFTQRSEAQYQEMAKILGEVVDRIPGNSAIFFPSYQLKDSVYKYLSTACSKTMFSEFPNMTEEQKQGLLERFKSYHKTGAVLMGVISGSFGEGIDLPGDLLKGVVIVGLPLQKPDLETKALIDYFDKKFKKGWDYGYLYPAFNKCLQSAGRCIRSETDRGVIIFLDERYTWSNYARCFPPDWKMRTTLLYGRMIEEFFKV